MVHLDNFTKFWGKTT